MVLTNSCSFVAKVNHSTKHSPLEESNTLELHWKPQVFKFLIAFNVMFDVGANVDNPLLQEVLLETMKKQLTS
jgi:hypothetical protein